ncbi:unnamed protein product [Trichobilharzia regenti]|nr:unnamed protein product [Trichobilharzia regenti]
MDPYSPSHPTDQDMDLESDSPATPEQDADQNQLPPNQSLSDVVPLIFNSDAFACQDNASSHQADPNLDVPHFDQSVSDQHDAAESDGKDCTATDAALEKKDNLIETKKQDDNQVNEKPSSSHERSSETHRRRSRSPSHKRVESRYDDRKSRRSRSHSRHRSYKHRSRSRSKDRRRDRSRTPRRSHNSNRVRSSRSRSPARSRKPFNEKRASRFSDTPIPTCNAKDNSSLYEENPCKSPEVVRWNPPKTVEEQHVSEAVSESETRNSPSDVTHENPTLNPSVNVLLQNQPPTPVQTVNSWQNMVGGNSTFLPRVPQMNFSPMRFPQSNFGLVGIPNSTFPSGIIPYAGTPIHPNFMQPPPMMVPRVNTPMLPVNNAVFPGHCVHELSSNTKTSEKCDSIEEISPIKRINKLLSSAASSLLSHLTKKVVDDSSDDLPPPPPPPPPPPLPFQRRGDMIISASSRLHTFVPPPLPVVDSAFPDGDSEGKMLPNGANEKKPFGDMSMAEVLAKRKRYDFASRREWQERIALEVKSILKPAYYLRRINKEDYKEIMKKAVTKVRFATILILFDCRFQEVVLLQSTLKKSVHL